MSENSQSSLFRNGKVLTKRDLNGSDAGSEGINIDKKEMQIINARDSLARNNISIDSKGFEIMVFIQFNIINKNFYRTITFKRKLFTSFILL